MSDPTPEERAFVVVGLVTKKHVYPSYGLTYVDQADLAPAISKQIREAIQADRAERNRPDVLTTLTDEQLAKLEGLTVEQIDAALQKGLDDASGARRESAGSPSAEERAAYLCGICKAPAIKMIREAVTAERRRLFLQISCPHRGILDFPSSGPVPCADCGFDPHPPPEGIPQKAMQEGIKEGSIKKGDMNPRKSVHDIWCATAGCECPPCMANVCDCTAKEKDNE